jgi:ATP-dependent DNA helicase RecG
VLDGDLAVLVDELRAIGSDFASVEVKAAERGLPRSVRETLSAFSNGQGGLLVLGLAEEDGFRPAPGFDAAKIRDDLASCCSDELTPPVRADIEIQRVDDAYVVVADVPEVDSRQKPCYVTARGMANGSYLRGGDGDRRLTQYEIQQLLANHGQPLDDDEIVADARIDDLDRDAVTLLLSRVRRNQPRVFAPVADVDALVRLHVVRLDSEGTPRPTLAGLFALGVYPQQFAAQLAVSIVVVPGTSMNRADDGGQRFIDNRTIEGSVPSMVEEALSTLRANMARRAVVDGVGRLDVPEYPIEALREAVVNALMHRDYSPLARATQVQIEMYSDRLVIRNPGGLFGTITEEQLGLDGVTSNRNSRLARLLQDVVVPGTDRVVCENRGSGIPTMIAQLRRAGMDPPEFRSTLSSFELTLPRSTVLDDETVHWLSELRSPGLGHEQRVALALMRQGHDVTNATLRRLGLERHEATAALRDLVDRGLVVSTGGRKYAKYGLRQNLAEQPESLFGDLLDETPPHGRVGRPSRRNEVMQLFDDGRTLTVHEVMEATGLGIAMVRRYLSQLVETGQLVATAQTTDRRRAYRRARR